MSEVSARQVRLLDRLLRSDGDLTLSDLAAELGVSVRTIQREMPAVEQWLAEVGVQVTIRTGIGMQVKAPGEQRQRALTTLTALNPDRELSVEERQNRVLHELLRIRNAKLAYFARKLGVTETTISNDLDRLELWLKERGLTLVRRPGMGVDLVGSELNIRRAMTALLRRNLTDEQLYDQLWRVTHRHDVKGYLLEFIDPGIVLRIEQTLAGLSIDLEDQFSDSAVAGLIVHLALTMERIRQHEPVHISPAVLLPLKATPEWAQAARIVTGVGQALGLPLPESEIGYITMHLRGARLRNTAGHWATPGPEDQQAMAMASAMVRKAEELLAIPVGEVPGLIHGLAMHLVPAINRIRMGLEIRNPLLSQVRDEYPEIFEASRAVCRVLSHHLGIPVPETEAGFVAMHLGAAADRLRSKGQPQHRAVVVCPTGVGSSRLLSGRLSYAMPELEIIDVVSVVELPAFLRTLAVPPDIILSTVPLDIASIPVVTVGPLMRSPDMAAVRRRLKELPPPVAARVRGRQAGGPSPTHDEPESEPEALAQRAAVMGAIMVDLLKSFRLLSLTVQSPIEAVAGLLATAGVPNDPALVERDLERRESLGSTMVNEMVQLLHVRTQGVRSVFLGLLRSEEQSVVVMLAPESCSPESLEVLGAVSIGLVEQPEFLKAICQGTEEQVKKALGRLLQPLLFQVKGQKGE